MTLLRFGLRFGLLFEFGFGFRFGGWLGLWLLYLVGLANFAGLWLGLRSSFRSQLLRIMACMVL